MKQPWDMTHIASAIRGATEAIAGNFYEMHFEQLPKREQQLILRAIAAQCRELAAAC